MQLKINRTQDVVEAGTQAATSDNGNLGLGRFEEELLARACPLEELHCVPQAEGVVIMHLIENEGALDGAERIQPQRRADCARAVMGDLNLFAHENLNRPDKNQLAYR